MRVLNKKTVKVVRIEYSVRNTGVTADDIRDFVRNALGVDCFVAIHPGRVKIVLSSPVPESALETIDSYLKEHMDGVRVVTM